MNNKKINYAVDMLALLAFLATAVSGLAIYFFLPEGVRRGGYQEFLGVTKHAWSQVHNISGLSFIVLAFVHLILHWQWVVTMTKAVFFGKKGESAEDKD